MEDFKFRKQELLEKIVPHLIRPDIYPAPRLSIADCAILMSKNEKNMLTQAFLRKTEQSALAKLKFALKKNSNINGISDILYSK